MASRMTLAVVNAVLILVVLTPALPAARGCDCGSGKPVTQPAVNSLQPAQPASPRGSPPKSSLDDILTPQLVQSYLTLQLHRAALDLADEAARAPGTRCSSQGAGPCGPGYDGAPHRRTKRFTPASARSEPDVPVLKGLAGLPSTSSLVALRPSRKNDDSNDVPVFKGNHEGSPLLRVVTASPTASARGLLTSTTEPSVPVVKGSPDPAHPTTPRTALVPGDIQLTPEEEEALAVLLEGRHNKKPGNAPARPRPTPRPSALRPTRPPGAPTVASVSGKVGGKTAASAGASNCCSQKRLLQELEKQLSILRQLNADHMREEWVRSSYPSPYYPYLHNLPVHPARGYDDAPALLPTYYLSSTGYRRRSPAPLLPVPPPSYRSSAPAPGSQNQPASDCDWWTAGSSPRSGTGDADQDGGHLDDKVRFNEQLREEDDLRGTDPQDDVGVDPKIGDPVDFEIR